MSTASRCNNGLLHDIVDERIAVRVGEGAAAVAAPLTQTGTGSS